MLRIRRIAEEERICVVVPVFHREEITLEMLEQLRTVTPSMRLIIVNSGFDREKELLKFKPWRYVKMQKNRGAICAVNRGLDEAEGEYVSVLHNDLMIYEEGWLGHAVDFMEKRPCVGIVGFAGRHTVNGDGSLELESTVVNMRGYPQSLKPSWRFTEVAVIDGLGWVMRNLGLRIDGRYGFMHYYDLDISLQFIAAGFRVYVIGVDILHLADPNAVGDKACTTRSREDYLSEVGGDDAAYYERAKSLFRDKWADYLPITRGWRDESYFSNRLGEFARELEEYKAHEKSIAEYVRKLEAEIRSKDTELRKAATYARKLEGEYFRLKEELRRSKLI